jgi:ribonuclease HII
MADKDMLALETSLLTEPGTSIISFDEVGRGAIAGPLAVGAVYLTKETLDKIAFARDSKSMSAKRREEMFEKLERTGIPYGIGWVEAEVIDEIGITASLRRAAHLAMAGLPEPTSYLVDGNLDIISEPGSPDPRVVLQIKGDANCASIAAASVLAKVSRDRVMVEMDSEYPGYGFAGHKGYGAKTHYLAIQEKGFSPIHRKSWKLPSWVTLPES